MKLLMILAGVLSMGLAQIEWTTYEDANVSFQYPAEWVIDVEYSREGEFAINLGTSEAALESMNEAVPTFADGEAAVLVGALPVAEIAEDLGFDLSTTDGILDLLRLIVAQLSDSGDMEGITFGESYLATGEQGTEVAVARISFGESEGAISGVLMEDTMILVFGASAPDVWEDTEAIMIEIADSVKLGGSVIETVIPSVDTETWVESAALGYTFLLPPEFNITLENDNDIDAAFFGNTEDIASLAVGMRARPVEMGEIGMVLLTIPAEFAEEQGIDDALIPLANSSFSDIQGIADVYDEDSLEPPTIFETESGQQVAIGYLKTEDAVRGVAVMEIAPGEFVAAALIWSPELDADARAMVLAIFDSLTLE